MTRFEPSIESWPDTGVYQLWLRVSVDICVAVGRLGRFAFPAGRYVYTGRASRGLRARVLRHARGAAKKHWHIDYLLAKSAVRVVSVRLASEDPEAECVVNEQVGGKVFVPGFGASDCQAGCGAHLKRIL